MEKYYSNQKVSTLAHKILKTQYIFSRLVANVSVTLGLETCEFSKFCPCFDFVNHRNGGSMNLHQVLCEKRIQDYQNFLDVAKSLQGFRHELKTSFRVVQVLQGGPGRDRRQRAFRETIHINHAWKGGQGVGTECPERNGQSQSRSNNRRPRIAEKGHYWRRTWIYGFESETTQQASKRCYKNEPRPKKARKAPRKVKVMLTVFFYYQGIVHYEFQQQGSTITADSYLGGHFNNFRYLQELHGKNYQGLEDQVRKAIFEENLKNIVQHNLEYELGMHSYYLGINKYSDWSSQEFTKHMNGLIVSEDRTMDLYEPSGDMELPSSLDWRSKGYVTGVKDQGQCGSCWAFSTTGGLEGQHYRKTGKLVSLSEKNLVDCSTSNSGCDGGAMSRAYDYIIDNGGIDTEESYPYKPERDQCQYNKSNIGATCKDFMSVNQDEESLKQALAAVGPISIAIDASGKAFQQYKGGVYNNPDCGNAMGSLNHGVLLVGYGQENGIDYWLVKNSWTESWGEKGYIKMSRNKNNQCGIATFALYPIV
ncbi:CTSL [Cordylochernes scorpioides]|uniref:CTSL n=1 Tax=Cordylochernes scorpioides TaxID=51811 RepID=A0ABY6JZA4_9ARAC|nr:CTSL [Cordylochernes scorpioides]